MSSGIDQVPLGTPVHCVRCTGGLQSKVIAACCVKTGLCAVCVRYAVASFAIANREAELKKAREAAEGAGVDVVSSPQHVGLHRSKDAREGMCRCR